MIMTPLLRPVPNPMSLPPRAFRCDRLRPELSYVLSDLRSQERSLEID